MRYAGDVFRRGPVFHCHHGFGNYICRPGANDMNAQHFVGFFVGQYFYQTIRIHAGAGTAQGFERESAAFIGFALFF